jgi:hypothetical protein
LNRLGSIYSSIGASNADAEPFHGVYLPNARARHTVAGGALSAALGCAEIRETLANFDAKEKMQEKITVENYNKLFEQIDGIIKQADNLVTNPIVLDASSDVERLRFREAQSLIKKAYEMATADRPNREKL